MISGHHQLFCEYDLALTWDNDWFENLHCAIDVFSFTFPIAFFFLFLT